MAVSFSSAAKAEVCRSLPQKHCCAMAECFGILLFCNSFASDGIKIITESREFVTTAINILANKAVNFNEFPYNFYSEEKLPELLEQRATELKNNALPEQMDVLKFVF